MGKVETNSFNEVKPTNDATNNITFDTLLDTQFFASKINKASDMFERMGYVKNGKLYDYNSEISGIVKEIEPTWRRLSTVIRAASWSWSASRARTAKRPP